MRATRSTMTSAHDRPVKRAALRRRAMVKPEARADQDGGGRQLHCEGRPLPRLAGMGAQERGRGREDEARHAQNTESKAHQQVAQLAAHTCPLGKDEARKRGDQARSRGDQSVSSRRVHRDGKLPKDHCCQQRKTPPRRRSTAWPGWSSRAGHELAPPAEVPVRFPAASASGPRRHHPPNYSRSRSDLDRVLGSKHPCPLPRVLMAWSVAHKHFGAASKSSATAWLSFKSRRGF